MIDIRKLKELVRLMVENELTELDLRDSEEQVTMRRPNPNAPGAMLMAAPQLVAYGGGHAPPAAQSSNGAGAAPAARETAATAVDSDAGLIKIESPMVGTFYAAGKPDAPPFASVGANISPGKPVCIIEAMKIFNEIKAEVSGVVQKVLVKNGDAVEFGQTLFLVKPV